MKMMSIASGSSGNCIYIGTEKTHVLIDAGVSKKKIIEGLKTLHLTLADIDAILITHEHDDHIKGIGVVERQCKIPLYGTEQVLQFIQQHKSLGVLPSDIYNPIQGGSSFVIQDLMICTVGVSHDALDPVAYVLSSEGKKIGIITDLGVYTDDIIEQFTDLDTMLIESNHDVNMVQVGPYPYYLKERILGAKGHLSNEDCGRMLNRILNDKIEYIFLGHLSKENNFPELAYETVRMEIDLGDNPYKASDFRIQVANRDIPSEIIIV